MHVAALVIAALSLLPAHARSEGRAKFKLDDTGRVDVKITLSTLDMPELCNLDLAVSDVNVRAERLRLLDTCIRKDLPSLLRVRADATSCNVVVASTAVEKGTVSIDAMASCPQFPDARVIVDWGLFAGHPLDHVAVTTFEQPHARPKLVMLSKRSNKLVVDIVHPLWPKVLGASLALLVVIVALAVVVVRARRRRVRGGAPGLVPGEREAS
jgi:hypothetical protein